MMIMNKLDMLIDKYPELSDCFKKIQLENMELFAGKHLDYGPYNISLGTPLTTKKQVRMALLGIAIRLNDKINRMINILSNDLEINNESLDDTLRDISNYGVIGSLILQGNWETK
jgi:hypothetical protein